MRIYPQSETGTARRGINLRLGEKGSTLLHLGKLQDALVDAGLYVPVVDKLDLSQLPPIKFSKPLNSMGITIKKNGATSAAVALAPEAT